MANATNAAKTTEDQKEVSWDSLEQALTQVPHQFREFSIIMRALYSTEKVSGKTKEGKHFNTTRDQIRDDSLIYKRQLFPVVEDFIVKLRDFIDNYITLDFEDWAEDLEGIYKEVCQYEQGSGALRALHEKLVAKFKKHEDNLNTCIKGMELPGKHYERLVDELKAKAEEKKKWAIGLAFVPLVGPIVSAVLAGQAGILMKTLTAEQQNNVARMGACSTARERMLPALHAITVGLSTMQSFFAGLKQELAGFALGASNALNIKADGESPPKRHFLKTRAKAKAIDKTCKLFCVNIEPVKSDLEALPTEDADMNYIDTWLMNELKEFPQESTWKQVFKKLCSKETMALLKTAVKEGSKLVQKTREIQKNGGNMKDLQKVAEEASKNIAADMKNMN